MDHAQDEWTKLDHWAQRANQNAPRRQSTVTGPGPNQRAPIECRGYWAQRPVQAHCIWARAQNGFIPRGKTVTTVSKCYNVIGRRGKWLTVSKMLQCDWTRGKIFCQRFFYSFFVCCKVGTNDINAEQHGTYARCTVTHAIHRDTCDTP